MIDENDLILIDERIAAAISVHALATDVHGMPALAARVTTAETAQADTASALATQIADNDAHGLADVRASVAAVAGDLAIHVADTNAHGLADVRNDLVTVSGNFATHIADTNAHGLAAVRTNVTTVTSDLAAHVADDGAHSLAAVRAGVTSVMDGLATHVADQDAHSLTNVRADAAAASAAIKNLVDVVALHLVDRDAHGLPEVRDALGRAAALVGYHAVDLDSYGLVALRRQVAQQLAVGALPPLRTDEFDYADGPLTGWTQYIRQPSVLNGHLVAPALNSLPYGITMPVTAPLQRIVAAISFSSGGNVRFLLRDGGDDAAVISVESTGLVIHRRADLSEVTRLSLYEILPAMTGELLCDWSVLGNTVSLNVNGVPIYSFETSGTTGNAISIALTNGGQLNRIAIYGAAA